MSNKNTQTNYQLTGKVAEIQKGSTFGAIKKIGPMLKGEGRGIIISLIATLFSSGMNLLAPLIIGYSIDRYIVKGNYHGLVNMSMLLAAVYLISFFSSYAQMRVMGGIAQRTLYKLRNELFVKLQDLPLSFFNQNKSGDLIARINSDTSKINDFFSQSLMRFVGNMFMIIGTGIFILSIRFDLAAVSLIPAVFVVIFLQIVSRWVRRANKKSLTSSGLLSAETEESITNFKVILAFNRRDYFREKFRLVNKTNYSSAIGAGIANELITPVFEFMGNLALLITLAYGLYLVIGGGFAIGLLVSFVIYITKFYDPLREMARLWSTLQGALAAWDRIGIILAFESDLKILDEGKNLQESVEIQRYQKKVEKPLLEFRDVSFTYLEGKEVLKNTNLIFEKGKTYALVGPTGGGKTTTASLIARLFDPTSGTVYLKGKDIRSYTSKEKTDSIGFILQEPYLFSGTIQDNLVYGTESFLKLSQKEFKLMIDNFGLSSLLSRFEKGLDTKIDNASNLSLGEKQIIAFMRAVIREPDILILDEATANIDTVTEQVLDDILKKLPVETTKVIIAHRLNTIENADNIYFVNGGNIIEAGTVDHAVEMLLSNKRES